MHPRPTLTVLAAGQVADLPLSPSGRLPFWASPFPRRLANASGRIEFIIFLIMDWLFASGCSPPRLSATQLPSATDSQCSVRRGLSPRCWCALSGARGALLATPRGAASDSPSENGPETGPGDCFCSFWTILRWSNPIYLQRHPPRCCLTNKEKRRL